MAKIETDITNSIAVELAPLGSTLFKNVRGFFLSLDGKRKITAGLQPNGSSDLIGLTKVLITPDMVGQTIGVFTAIEVKTPTGAVRDNQAHFIKVILKYGGYAGIARNTEDAKKIIKK